MSFRIRKSYFKIGNVNKEERKEFKSCRVKTILQLAKIDLEEELAEGIKSHERLFFLSNLPETGRSARGQQTWKMLDL